MTTHIQIVHVCLMEISIWKRIECVLCRTKC